MCDMAQLFVPSHWPDSEMWHIVENDIQGQEKIILGKDLDLLLWLWNNFKNRIGWLEIILIWIHKSKLNARNYVVAHVENVIHRTYLIIDWSGIKMSKLWLL